MVYLSNLTLKLRDISYLTSIILNRDPFLQSYGQLVAEALSQAPDKTLPQHKIYEYIYKGWLQSNVVPT